MDAWTYAEDSILLDCIAQALREGKTIQRGIIDAAIANSRTPGACARRYYSEIDRENDPRMQQVREAEQERIRQKIQTFRKKARR